MNEQNICPNCGDSDLDCLACTLEKCSIIATQYKEIEELKQQLEEIKKSNHSGFEGWWDMRGIGELLSKQTSVDKVKYYCEEAFYSGLIRSNTDLQKQRDNLKQQLKAITDMLTDPYKSPEQKLEISVSMAVAYQDKIKRSTG